ncbi:MAG TPA: hypothetical protein PK335_07085 [Draconibacterium sp.]|nr:hypothetical protein [Draconibacterium sp.]
MPSIKIITPILGGNYYHIFNRGINRQAIFFEEKNYAYFLHLMKQFVVPYVSVLAYCLIPNHFHLVIKVKEEILISEGEGIPSLPKDGILIKDEIEIGKWVSRQYRRMFITYSMAINKQENRTGSLLDKNFKRLEITENEYLKYVIYYAHFNPKKHGLVEDFINYKYSSYSAMISEKETNLDRELVYEIFEGEEGFKQYHRGMHEEQERFILE